MCICSHKPIVQCAKYACVSTSTWTQACLSLPCACVRIGVSSVICVLSIVRVCQCVLAEFQILRRQQQDPQFQCQVTQCPIIPHNPPCLQAGDPSVSLCVCVCVCAYVHVFVPGLALMTSANCGYSRNALETHFPISLSLHAVTSGLGLSQPRLSLIMCFVSHWGVLGLLNIKTRPLW